eukprot:525018-Pleurochrysis_carterae.AAC.1
MAAQSAAYPEGLNEALAEALTRAADSLAGRTEEPAREQRGHGAAGPQRGGRQSEGVALGGDVRAAVEAAREAPATFISARKQPGARGRGMSGTGTPAGRPAQTAACGKGGQTRARQGTEGAATPRSRRRRAAERGGTAPGRHCDTPALRPRRVRDEGTGLVRAGGRGGRSAAQANSGRGGGRASRADGG